MPVQSQDNAAATAIEESFISSNETDSNLESANVVDGLYFVGRSVARALDRLGTADAATPMGGLEAHAVLLKEGAESIASALNSIAESISDLAEAIRLHD